MRRLSLLLPALLAVSCQGVKPYAPLPQQARVESVEVEIRSFEGRPEAYAVVKGRLSTSAAQLIDPRQSRVERSLVIEVLEQTPRGANLLPDLTEAPPFEKRIPIEILGLEPGPCLLYVNGIATSFEIPPLQAALASEIPGPANYAPTVTLIDEFIPIEDAVPGTALPGVATPGVTTPGSIIAPLPMQHGGYPAPVATPISGGGGTSF